MTPYTLRPYQADAAAAGLAYLSNAKLRGRHGLIIAPTGSGKSLVIAKIATSLGEPCIVLQPSKEILEQNLQKLAHYGYRASVFSASMGRKEIGTITLGTIGTVLPHLDAFRGLRTVLIDECHVANARGGMYDEFIEALTDENSRLRVLGFTATPYRLASNSFGSQLRFLTRTQPKIFRDVVHFTQIGDLFRDGYLCPLQYRDVPAVPRERLKLNKRGSDYTDESVADLFGEVGFVGQLQREVEYELDCGRKNVLVFTRFVEEARRLAKVIRGASVVTADTPAGVRANVLKDFKSGRLQVIANVGVIALGFDYPELESVILARPSISLGLYYQQVGRIVRPHPDKPVAHVVDMVGLTKLFGKVEDLTLMPGAGKQIAEVNAVDWSAEKPVAPRCLWQICSGDRPLTNVFFAERDGLSVADIRIANNRRQYWAKRKPKALL